MEYSNINQRLKEIKIEIFELGSASDANLISKIESLSMINRLLKEQNRLLAIKQEYIYQGAAA
jgi:hypothetical protein